MLRLLPRGAPARAAALGVAVGPATTQARASSRLLVAARCQKPPGLLQTTVRAFSGTTAGLAASSPHHITTPAHVAIVARGQHRDQSTTAASGLDFLKGVPYTEMTVGIPREVLANECRVAGTPETVAKLVAQGFKVRVEKGAGERAGFTDKMVGVCGEGRRVV